MLASFDQKYKDLSEKPWLKNLGFDFDPFQHLESSSDPNIGEYLIGHDLFAVAWDDTPALLFAPAGGGKTAMRIYAARACWAGRGGTHAFPIPYLLPHGVLLSPGDHLRGIATAGAAALLIGLLFRPELLFGLEPADRRAVAAVLDAALPSPLSRYVEMLRAEESPADVAALLDRSYRFPPPREALPVAALCDALEEAMPRRRSVPREEQLFERLMGLLLRTFHFRSVFVQVDNVDGAPDMVDNPLAMAERLAWLLEQAPQWMKRRIYVKGFVPSELPPVLQRRTPGVLAFFRQAQLQWRPELLAEVVRRRIYVATGGAAGSLDSFAGPELRDIETLLARECLPLPREMILLASCALDRYAQRTGGKVGQISRSDLDAALEWYKAHSVDPGPLPG